MLHCWDLCVLTTGYLSGEYTDDPSLADLCLGDAYLRSSSYRWYCITHGPCDVDYRLGRRLLGLVDVVLESSASVDSD
jgi:hypothetical protein